MLADPASEDALLSHAMEVAGSGVLLVPTMHRSLPTGGFCSSTVLLFRISPSFDGRFTGSTLKTSQPPSPFLCLSSSKNMNNTFYALRQEKISLLSPLLLTLIGSLLSCFYRLSGR